MGDNIYLGDRNGVRTPMQWSARPQRRLLARQPAAALPAGRSSTPSTTTRRSTSRRSRTTRSSLLWWMKRLHRAAQALPGLRPRRPSSSCTPRTARCWPSCARYEDERDPGRRQPVALRAVRRARPLALPRLGAGRAVRPDPLPAHRRAALPAHPGPARLLLARPSRAQREDERRPVGRRRGAAARAHAAPSTRSSTGRARGQLERALAALPARAPLVRGQGARHPQRRGHRLRCRSPACARRCAARVLIVRWSSPRARPRPTPSSPR